MRSITDKKIAIIGGGPGGLTLARLLQIKGADVTVYERDMNSEARAQGATLDLHDESGLAAIRAGGLWHEFMASYRPGADYMRMVDKHAGILMQDSADKGGEHARPEIDRGPLQKILLNSLQPGTVVWDSHFLALTSQNNGWKLDFKNGKWALADIVIAADGANSKIRPYITPIKPFYVGITAIEGAVYQSEMAAPRIHKLLNGGKIFAFGDSKSLIVSSKGDGSLVYYASFEKDEFWSRESGIDFNDKSQVINWFKEEYKDWDDIWLELFERASGSFIPRPQYCMPLDQTWEPQPNLTMLGDAAHLMPPFAGEGVNMAMLDALELSNCLTGDEYPDVASAIAGYEKQMRVRAAEVGDFTLQSTAALHSPGAINFMNAIFS